MSFFSELKRRNVFRVGVAYGVATWLLLQAIDFSLDVMDAPNWIIQVLVLLAVIGLPAVLTFAWVFEMTPEGIKRETDVQRDESLTSHTAKKLNKLTIGLLIAVVAIVIVDRFVPQTDHETRPITDSSAIQSAQPVVTEKPKLEKQRPSMPSVAVLPFTNMSSDPDNEYFSDGISEELLNLLVQVDGLRVPSRTSSFAFKGMNMDIKEIARQLAVEHVLEGSVRKSGNQVRITAQLIDVSTDTHLWSNTYDRELENIFAVQDEISREIIRELEIALDTSGLVSREQSRPTENMQAYQDYLRGRHFFMQRGIPSLKASLEALQSAVALDPAFAEAWAALSLAAATLTSWDQENAEITDQIALDAGNRALQLDKNSATALTGLGLWHTNQGNWALSIELLEQTVGLSKDSNSVYFYGVILQTVGYITEAHEKFIQAERLDPVYPQLQNYLGLNAMARGDLAIARVHFQRTIDGGNANGTWNMYWVELNSGNFDAAIGYLQDIARFVEAGLITGYQSDSLLAVTSAIKEPTLLASGIRAATNGKDMRTLSHFGAVAEIMQILNSSLADGDLLGISNGLSDNLWAPEFSSLRQMPEYRQLLRGIGLVDLWKTRGWPDLCHAVGEDDFKCE